MNDPLILDGSTLGDVAKCPRKAVARAWHGLTSTHEAATLRAGSAIHVALDHYFRSTSPKLALHMLAEEYQEFGSDPSRVPQDDRLSYANVRRIFTQWLEDHPVEGLPFTVHHAERFFAEWLDERVLYVGRVDGDATWKADGRPYLLENKTTGRVSKDWKDKFIMDAQLSGYMWAANKRAGGYKYVGVILNAIELNKLPGGGARASKCREHGVPYSECGSMHNGSEVVLRTRTPEALDEWHTNALRLAAEYWDTVSAHPDVSDLQHITPRGKFNNECQWCFMKQVCQQQAVPEVVGQLLVVDRWEPTPGVQPGTWMPASGVLAAAQAMEVSDGQQGEAVSAPATTAASVEAE